MLPVTNRTDIILPIVVWYNPAGIAEDGTLVYYEDVYNRFKLQNVY
jgi:hypothetical protein